MYVALQYAASFHCLVEEWKDCAELKPKPNGKWSLIDKKVSEGMKHRTEWCAEADGYRCMTCGRESKIHEDARTLYWTKIIVKKFGKMEEAPSGRS